MRTSGWRRQQLERGAAMVEFAIVAMLFLTLVIGLIDFGLGIFYYNMLSNAAREGARVGIINKAAVTADTMCNAAASKLRLPGVAYNAGNTCIDYDAPLKAEAANAVPGDEVWVRLTYAYEPVTPLVQGLVGETISLTAYSSMIKEN